MTPFWPFKKKPEHVDPEQMEKVEPETKQILIDLADLIPHLAESKGLPYNGDEKEVSNLPCPTEHRTFKVCVCMDCPKRDSCVVEADLRSGDCKLRFARACSVKSGGKPTGFENIIVDSIVHDAIKKIAEAEENWTYKKPKERDKDERKEEYIFKGDGI